MGASSSRPKDKTRDSVGIGSTFEWEEGYRQVIGGDVSTKWKLIILDDQRFKLIQTVTLDGDLRGTFVDENCFTGPLRLDEIAWDGESFTLHATEVTHSHHSTSFRSSGESGRTTTTLSTPTTKTTTSPFSQCDFVFIGTLTRDHGFTLQYKQCNACKKLLSREEEQYDQHHNLQCNFCFEREKEFNRTHCRKCKQQLSPEELEEEKVEVSHNNNNNNNNDNNNNKNDNNNNNNNKNQNNDNINNKKSKICKECQLYKERKKKEKEIHTTQGSKGLISITFRGTDNYPNSTRFSPTTITINDTISFNSLIDLFLTTFGLPSYSICQIDSSSSIIIPSTEYHKPLYILHIVDGQTITFQYHDSWDL